MGGAAQESELGGRCAQVVVSVVERRTGYWVGLEDAQDDEEKRTPTTCEWTVTVSTRKNHKRRRIIPGGQGIKPDPFSFPFFTDSELKSGTMDDAR